MREDHEELVLRNPAVAACANWYVARAYANNSKGKSPTLLLLMVANAIVFHKPSVDKTSRMNFDSGLLKAVSEQPDLIAGLQQRMEAGAYRSLVSVQLGCSSGILVREGGDGLPTFRAEGIQLPTAIRDGHGDVTRMYASAKRIGTWFAAESVARLKQILMVEF